MPIAKRPPPELFKFSANIWTQPFWDRASRHVLAAPRCRSCGTWRMPPTPFCPNCQSQDVEWPSLSGSGTVYSYTIVTRGLVAGMEQHLPYAPAVIELDGAEGVRLISNVVDVDVEEIHVGMAVHVVWDDVADGQSLPRFALAA